MKMKRFPTFITRNWQLLSLIFMLLLEKIDNTNVHSVHKKFEYKYSFKPPYLAQKDGSVPFWEYGGNAIASADNVRIAPSLRSQKGGIWTKQPINFDWWEVDVAFRITGRGRIGADGLAFWYTAQKGSYDGDVFGSSDRWNGLGVIFDSFDNDNKHNNPYIMAVINDGSQQFDHQNDGTTQLSAGCLRDFRNKPFPTRARIEYYQNTLTLLFHNGMTSNDMDYDMCFRLENVILPKNGYFGLSAATGGLADDHDVIHFLTSSLHPTDASSVNNQVSGEEQQKLNKEYQDYQSKFQQQKDDYRKEHPDEQKEPTMEEWFETDSQRELRQIFQGQSKIFELVKDFEKKIDEVIGRQERTLSLITQKFTDMPIQPAFQNAGGDGQFAGKSQEVNVILHNQNQILGVVGELRQSLSEIRVKTDNILNKQQNQPTAQVHSIGYDTQSLVSEMRDNLNQIKSQFTQLNTKMNQPKDVAACPNINCISTVSMGIIAFVQLAVIICYNIYRDSRDHQAKKFY